ncbi:xanthine dehydrogenase accessory protein XdhC [Brevibacterium luteolum]|uniref:Xanthine dehydrogenase accessory protein XdhC n=2 Tax=Brevibacterium luteolum TaxID=199591 RepID=A0A6G8L0U9_9MICO|nr:xanthine dehydrogenase accessory protein XdhC [Brevibacterium luteolum]
MDTAAQFRRDGVPSVLITVAAVRGHAPREPGAKMVVTADEQFGSIGGGNLEMTAVSRARELLSERRPSPEMLHLRLNEKAPAEYGRQCCGGEVSVLFEPLPVPATAAVFGVGNVGLEVIRILARHDMELIASDSRPEYLRALESLEPPVARLRSEFAVVGEEVLAGLPSGAHVLIMTHDHAEDLHLCSAALMRGDLGSVGLIGSSAKWQRFRKNLLAEGFEAEAVDTIRCPIGLPELRGKHPAMIAVSAAADLLARIS